MTPSFEDIFALRRITGIETIYYYEPSGKKTIGLGSLVRWRFLSEMLSNCERRNNKLEVEMSLIVKSVKWDFRSCY